MTILPPPGDASRIIRFLQDHLRWSAFWGKKHGVWRDPAAAGRRRQRAISPKRRWRGGRADALYAAAADRAAVPAGGGAGVRGGGTAAVGGRRGRVTVRADGGDRAAEEHRRVHPGVVPRWPVRRETWARGDALQLVPASLPGALPG